MPKKNEPTNYTSNTLWQQIKQGLADKIVAFAFGAFVTLIGTYFTVLADHSRLVAVERDKADKKDVEIMNYKLDLMLEHFDIKFEPKE